MRLSREGQLALVLVPLAVMSLGTSKARTDNEGGTAVAGDPLAGDGSKLVGDWVGNGAQMHIGADKTVHFESHAGSTTKTYDGKLKAVEPGKLIVNALFDVTLNVQKMPTDVDGYSVMTVEGVDLYKGGAPGYIAAIITQKFKPEGIASTTCPATVTGATASFECTGQGVNFDPITDAGTPKSVKIQVTKKDDNGDYHFQLSSKPIDVQKLTNGMPKVLGPFNVTSVSCGPGPTVWLEVGTTFECMAVDAKTKKSLKIVVRRMDNDDIHFEASPR